MEWYVTFVETGKEEVVQKWLDHYFDQKTQRNMVPKRRLIEKKDGKSYPVIKKLFPGYVFICTDMNPEKYRIIKNIPNIIRFLSTGAYYSSIDDSEMSVILRLVGDDIIGCSKILVDNSKILVKEGCLYGMEGIIKKVDKHKNRAKIQLDFMGEPRTVDVGVEIIYKLD
jgi:transcriptional antiterminator NusG